jgi:hypothetical protein
MVTFPYRNSPKVNRVPNPKVKEGHFTAQNNDNGVADKDAAEGKLWGQLGVLLLDVLFAPV